MVVLEAALAVSLLCAPQSVPSTYRSAELGWKAGQDVTREFIHLLKGLGPGDKLVLEARYKLTGGPYQFPDDFTLEAVHDGGFDITDSKDNQQATFSLGDRNVLRNLTLVHPALPPKTEKTTNPQHGEHFFDKVSVLVEDRKECIFEYCRFEGRISHHISFKGGERHVIRNCHVIGGFWSVALAGGCLDFAIQNTFFQDVNGEAVKTCRGRNAGTQRARVENCVFQGCWRDGIDTTGGFKDGVVRDCIFRRNDVNGVGGGIDIKTVIEPKTVDGDLHPNLMNKNIRIERCQFIDVPNAIVITLSDRAETLDAKNAPQWAPHEIYIDDCTFERTADWPDEVRAILMKGGHSVHWKNLQRRGDVVLVRTMMIKQFKGRSLGTDEARGVLNVNFNGTELPPAAPRPYSEQVPFVYGPQKARQS